jgi:putative ubiquitin-RnfH superfamily antitoxin RatB of RatAB toxin-antitoxin module
MGNDVGLNVVVVYPDASRSVQEITLHVEPGCTVGDALRLSKLLQDLDNNTLDQLEFGVWARKVPLSHVLREGDRVELYRPLKVDPKVARRARFVSQGAKSKSAGLFAQRRAGAKAGY